VAGGAPMGRWFRLRGGEIEASVDVVDNGGALVAPFICPLGKGSRAVKGRVAAAVDL
jgi:hypothetical protein